MASSCRFAFAVHVLAVLAYKGGGAGSGLGGSGPNSRVGESGASSCSDALAGSVNTNPVVIRRLLSQLRKAGLVTTHKGMRGGSVLGLPPEAITLDAVYRAVEPAATFAPERPLPNQRCPVGAGITRVLDEVFASAQAALEAALEARTLRDVLSAMREEGAFPPSKSPAARRTPQVARVAHVNKAGKAA